MSGTPIEEVFDALRRGDQSALQKFFPRLRERLFHLAKQRLGGDRAEEVVQETLTTLWERRDSIEDAGHLLPFLFQVLRNKIGNAYMRAQKERDRKGEQDRLESIPANPHTAVSPNRTINCHICSHLVSYSLVQDPESAVFTSKPQHRPGHSVDR